MVWTNTAPPRMTVHIRFTHSRNRGTAAKAPYTKVKDEWLTSHPKADFNAWKQRVVMKPPINPCATGTLQLGTATNSKVKAVQVSNQGASCNTVSISPRLS